MNCLINVESLYIHSAVIRIDAEQVYTTLFSGSIKHLSNIYTFRGSIIHDTRTQLHPPVIKNIEPSGMTWISAEIGPKNVLTFITRQTLSA